MKIHEIVLIIILVPILSVLWSAFIDYLIKRHNDRRDKK